MKQLQRYFLLNVAKAFVPAFIALVLLMAVGVCLKLLHEGLDVVRLASLVRLVFAYSVPMVLPSAFLTAIILTFARLSADNELTAVRAAGIHMFRVVYPVLWAACVLAAVAAYFYFETVPRCDAAMRALKYEALKQILLDKAALSWSRKFSFPPVHIMYDDFSNGVMHNVVVLDISPSSRRPASVTTARTATIRSDPEMPERVIFQMNDCTTQEFERQKDGRPQTMESTDISYKIRTATAPEDMLSRRRYFALFDFIAEVKRLGAAVAAQPFLEDPEGQRKRAREELRLLRIEAGQYQKALADKRKDQDKYAVRNPRRLGRDEERAKAAIAGARQAIEELRPQQEECTRELGKATQNGTDWERVAALQERQVGLLSKVEAYNKQIADEQAHIDAVQRELQDDARRAARLEREIAILNQRGTELIHKQDIARKRLRAAENQNELLDVRIRIHKRLSQAVSVLTFALLGIPLGIAASRRSVMMAFGLSFAVVLLVFYLPLIFGQVAAEAGTVPVAPAIWAGNILTLAIGAVLTFKVVRR